ncbi:MAG: hypothetical protein KDD48_02840 [Bdellovibrionales bacterium]|nr:hypothetical protein [Bdellovibrionales bacterium]
MAASGALLIFIAMALAIPIFIGWTFIQINKIKTGRQPKSDRLVSMYMRGSFVVLPILLLGNLFMLGMIGMGGDSPLVYASLGVQLLGNLLLVYLWWKYLKFFKT